MTELIIPKDLFETILDHCRTARPNEACGILAGRGEQVSRVYAMTNIEPSPVSYFMDPGEQLRVQKEMRERGEEMVAIYHSHPQSPAYPSVKDVTLAFYEDSFYVIVSLSEGIVNGMKAFSIVEGTVSEIPLTIAD
ncbi:MAG: M67 family metallopeptidase [Nitrospirae bacterium]|nr:M67 family metallopeptidase [Nitrospirota bacterium]